MLGLAGAALRRARAAQARARGCISRGGGAASALACGYRVINEDDKPFDFTAALHSYFEVAGLGNAGVRGLKGLTYLDKSEDPANPKEGKEEREQVTFGDGLVDSVYKDAPEHVELDVGTGGHPHALVLECRSHLRGLCRPIAR